MNFDETKTKPVVFSKDSGCNTPDDVILDQVASNIRRRLPQIQPYEPNSNTAIIVGGGASLKTTEKELRDLYWAGGKIVALNGAYNWCIERNFKPSACVLLDAREFNAEFVKEPVEGCRYLLSSQCHPKTFDYCKGRETYIWHACTAGDAELDLLKEYYFDRTYPITLGTTVGVRSVSILRMLGFTRMEIFGLDSCWLNDEHHAYEQAENAKDLRMPVWIRPQGRDDLALRFECAPWHMKQAEDFQNLIKERGNLFQLNVHGPGLIASILKTGAKIEMEK